MRHLTCFFVVGVLSGPLAARASDCIGFLPPTAAYPVGAVPTEVRFADLDNDGDPDAITTNVGADSVSVLLNCGFGLFEPAVDYPTGPQVAGLATADMDGDGFQDILVVSADKFQDLIIFFNNGDATFGAPTTTGVLDDLAALATADVDGDGDIDVVAANRGGTLDIYRNNGTGGFSGQTNINVGGQPEDVLIADFNHDSRLDLACIDVANSAIILRIQSFSGGFLQSVTLNVGNTPTRLHADDLDGDGSLDLIASQFGAGEISIFYNEGGLNFSLEDVIGVADGPVGITSADFDADGDTDLAVANEQSAQIAVLNNQGARTFSAQYIDLGTSPSGVAAGDITQDGLTELAVTDPTDGSLTFLFNRGGDLNEQLQGNRPFKVASGDFDNDGDLDVVATAVADPVVHIYENSGGWLLAANPLASPAPSLDVKVADLDHDGNEDLVLVHPTDPPLVSIHMGNGDLTFQSPQSIEFGASSGQAAVIADFDGDGDPDIVAVCLFPGGKGFGAQLFLNDGFGAFSLSGGVQDALFRDLDAGDLDGDGDIDLAIARQRGGGINTPPGGVDVYLNDGAGNFSLNATYLMGSLGRGVRDVVLSDLDDDRILDMVALNRESGFETVEAWIGLGDGTFSSSITLVAGGSPFAVESADFDGDNDPDVAFTCLDEGTATVLLNDGEAFFSLLDQYEVGTDLRGLHPADINGDGAADLVVANENSAESAITVLYNARPGCPSDLDGSGSTDLDDLNAVLASFGSADETADTNGDGIVDLQDLNLVLGAFGTACP